MVFLQENFSGLLIFGKLIDPLADKLTQISILTVLCLQGVVPTWVLIVVAIKEISIIAGSGFLYNKNLVVSSNWYGKLATTIFYIAILFSMLSSYLLPSVHQYSINLYYIAVAVTSFSLIMYFRYYLKFVKEQQIDVKGI